MEKKKKIILATLAIVLIALATILVIFYRNHPVDDGYVRVYCFSGYPHIRAYRSGSGCSGQRLSRDSLVVFDTNVIEVYSDTLYAMFGEEWTVLSVDERYRSKFMECHLPRGSLHQYTRWTIEYQDGDGVTRVFEVNNYSPFYFHVIRHIEEKIQTYYQEHFFNVYIAQLMAEFPVTSQTVRARFVRRTDCMNPSSRIRENDPEWAIEAEEYRRNLATPEGAVPLNLITPRNVFRHFPIYLSFGLSATEQPRWDEQEAFWEGLFEGIEVMLGSLDNSTDGQVNVAVVLIRYWWTYSGGEPVFGKAHYNRHTDFTEFTRVVFERFIGAE